MSNQWPFIQNCDGISVESNKSNRILHLDFTNEYNCNNFFYLEKLEFFNVITMSRGLLFK